MKKSYSGVLLIFFSILIVAGAIAAIYAIFKNNPTLISVNRLDSNLPQVVLLATSTQNSSKSTSSEVVTTPPDISKGWKAYKDDAYRFSIKYPSNATLTTSDITNGEQVNIIIPKTLPPLGLNGLQLNVQAITLKNNEDYSNDEECSVDFETFTANNVDFHRVDISNSFGGTETSAVARAYCVKRDLVVYKIVPVVYYNRYEQVAPDKQATFNQFDVLVKAIHFRFE